VLCHFPTNPTRIRSGTNPTRIRFAINRIQTLSGTSQTLIRLGTSQIPIPSRINRRSADEPRARETALTDLAAFVALQLGLRVLLCAKPT